MAGDQWQQVTVSMQLHSGLVYSSTLAGYLWTTACTCGGFFLLCKALMLDEAWQREENRSTLFVRPKMSQIADISYNLLAV